MAEETQFGVLSDGRVEGHIVMTLLRKVLNGGLLSLLVGGAAFTVWIGIIGAMRLQHRTLIGQEFYCQSLAEQTVERDEFLRDIHLREFEVEGRLDTNCSGGLQLQYGTWDRLTCDIQVIECEVQYSIVRKNY